MTAQYGISASVPLTRTEPVMLSVTPAILSAGNANDYSPVDVVNGTSFYDAQIVRQSTHASGVTLTGLDATYVSDGQYVVIENLGLGTLTLVHESTSSSEGNRFTLPGSSSIAMAVGDSVMVAYDAPTSRWRVISSDISGGGSSTGITVVEYTATGAEGISFMVSIGSTLSGVGYKVLYSPQGVTNVPFVDLPQGSGDRTTTQFRATTVAPLTAGEKLVFVLFGGS